MKRPIRYGVVLLTASMMARSTYAVNTLGIDVSSAQGTINWTSVHGDGVEFAYARATVGITFQDTSYDSNMVNGKAAGLQMGAYQFSHLYADTPAQEANYFWNYAGAYIKADGKSLSPAIDFEVFSGHDGASSYTAWFNDWAADVKAKTASFMHPVIYVAACAGACDLTSGIGLAPWIANYGPSIGVTPGPWSSCSSCNWTGNPNAWTYWQFSDTGAITGISGDVDLDYYNGTLASLKSAEGVGN